MTPALRCCPVCWLLILFVVQASAVYAQVSPGPLSAPHHSLEGPLKCANCHIFGAGKPKLRCVHCHTAIGAEVSSGGGYHGHLVRQSKGGLDCARCHTEHNGEDFNIVRWPESKEKFDHAQTGYTLTGGHTGLRCDQCHNARHISATQAQRLGITHPNRTFLGLSPACLTCHEDTHRGQLGTDCQRCHSFTQWKPVRQFDHNTARFPLTGRHRDVQCAKCHRPTAANPTVTQYKGLNFADCSGCHQDPHRGAFAARCSNCHTADSWREVRLAGASFDHSKTHFPLTGKHEGLACLKCHKDANFHTPVPHAKCMDCHQDQHQGQFAHRTDHGECGSCHTDKGFRPATFTAADHRSTAYPLAGKHQDVPCAKCHPPAGAATNYHPAFKACLDCHRDPHGGQFAAAPLSNRCEECHTVDGFRPSTFTLARHQTSRFVLNGAHGAVPCLDCHRDTGGPAGRKFRFADLSCRGCHQDPHGDQPKCESCHGLRGWRELKAFDHSGTGFALAGAHVAVACDRCHRRQKDAALRLPFRGAPKECEGCHQDVHAGQFARGGSSTDCAGCHTPTHWASTVFDHDRRTNFALTGAHAKVPCRMCHTQVSEVNGRRVVFYKSTPRECSACHHQ